MEVFFFGLTEIVLCLNTIHKRPTIHNFAAQEMDAMRFHVTKQQCYSLRLASTNLARLEQQQYD